MNLVRHRAAISFFSVLGLALGLLSVAGWYGFAHYESSQARLAEIEPRHARLLGLQKADAPFRKAVLDAHAHLQRWMYPADQDVGKAGNDLQQRARRAAEVGGMGIVSSQVLPPRVEGKTELVTVTLTVEGTLQALQLTIAAMERDAPALFVDSLSIRMVEKGDPKLPQQVVAAMGLVSIRAVQ